MNQTNYLSNDDHHKYDIAFTYKAKVQLYFSNIINTTTQKKPKTVETRRILYSPKRTKQAKVHRAGNSKILCQHYNNNVPESLYMLNVVNAIKSIFIVCFFSMTFFYFFMRFFFIYFSKVCLVSYNIELEIKWGSVFGFIVFYKLIKLLCQDAKD